MVNEKIEVLRKANNIIQKLLDNDIEQKYGWGANFKLNSIFENIFNNLSEVDQLKCISISRALPAYTVYNKSVIVAVRHCGINSFDEFIVFVEPRMNGVNKYVEKKLEKEIQSLC